MASAAARVQRQEMQDQQHQQQIHHMPEVRLKPSPSEKEKRHAKKNLDSKPDESLPWLE